MPRLLNGFLLLCMLLAQTAVAQDEVTPTPDATPVPVAAETPALVEAPTAGIILIETSGEPSHKLYQKVADALKSKGVKVLPGDDPIGKPVRLQAEIHAAAETSTETILDLIKVLKSLSVERFKFAATSQDGGNQLIVICPDYVSYRHVRTITEAIMELDVMKAREFNFDVRVAGSNDPVTPVEVPTYEDPNAPVPASRDIFYISPEGKSKITRTPTSADQPTLTEPRPSGQRQPSPQFEPSDAGYDTTPANPQAPRYNPYRSGDPSIIPPQPVPSYSPYAPAKPKLIEPQVKIFRLQQADVASVGKIVEQLLGGDPHNSLTVVPDERTNSLIVRGEEKLLLEVEAIILRLDEPIEKEKTSGINTGISTGELAEAIRAAQRPGGIFHIETDEAEPGVPELLKQYHQLEQKAKELAARQRYPLPDPATGDKWNAQLRSVVEQAFATRQKLQRAELAEFARRLQKIQQSIEQREKLQKQIIDRRVEELLDPRIEWNASTPVESPAIKSLQQTESKTSYSEAAPDSDQQSSEDLGNLFSRTPPSPDSKLILGKSPEEMHELLLQHSKQISQIKESIQRWENRRDEESDAENARNSMEQLRGQLVEYQRKQALAHAEYEEQLKYLESVLILQQTALSVAENNVRFAQRLQQKGYVSAGEIEREKIKLQDANVAVQRTESLLKLYRQAGTGLVPQAETSSSLSESAYAEPRANVTFKTETQLWSDKLRGSWNAKMSDHSDGKLKVSTMLAEVSGTQIHFSTPDGSDHGWFQFRVGATTVPQQIDIMPILTPQDRQELDETGSPGDITWHGIIEQTKDGFRFFLPVDFRAPRPESFDINPAVGSWELSPLPPTTESGSTETFQAVRQIPETGRKDEELLWQVFGARFERTDKLPSEEYYFGLKVTELRPDGPAEKAGIKVGDIVVEIDRSKTTLLHNLSSPYKRAVTLKNIARPVEVSLFREEELMSLDLSWSAANETARAESVPGTVTQSQPATEPLPAVQDSFNSPSAPAAVPVRQADTPGSPIVEPVVAPAATPLSDKSFRKLEGIWTPTLESRKLLDPELLKKGDEADLKITVDTTLGDSLPKQGNWDKFLSQSKTYWGGSELTVLATGLVGHPAESPETHHNFYMVLRNGAGKTFLQIGLVFGASPELELSGEGAHSLLSLVWTEQDSSLSPISPDVESQKIEYRPREEKR